MKRSGRMGVDMPGLRYAPEGEFIQERLDDDDINDSGFLSFSITDNYFWISLLIEENSHSRLSSIRHLNAVTSCRSWALPVIANALSA